MVGTRAIGPCQLLQAWRASRPPGAASLPTPLEAREFLETLADRELVRQAAVRKAWRWTAEDSAGYLALADRLSLRAALARALAEARDATKDTTLDDRALGILARRRAAQALDPRWDEDLLERTSQAFARLPRPSADSSLGAQLRILATDPAIAPADTGLALARTREIGDYTVADLLRQWRALEPYYRPRIESADDVRDLVANGLFERRLRREANAHDASDPAVRAALDEEKAAIAQRHFLSREIADRILPDSVAVRRWHHAHADRYALPGRWIVTRLILTDRAAATRLALDLRDPAAAESLAARGARQGADYRAELSAAQDSADFAVAAAAGLGAVTGPDSTAQGWRVMRVEAWQDPRVPGFEEVQDRAWRDWYTAQASERLQALLARERSRIVVRLHPERLTKLDALVAGDR